MKPTIAESQRIYRQAWQQYLLTDNDTVKKELEAVMDEAQPYCTNYRHPSPEWDAFIDTLPGYREHWEGLKADCVAMVKDLQERG